MENRKALDFCLHDQNDKKVCLADFKGRWVVLYFYPKDNSKTCILEDVTITDNLKSFEELGALVVGVALILLRATKILKPNTV